MTQKWQSWDSDSHLFHTESYALDYFSSANSHHLFAKLMNKQINNVNKKRFWGKIHLTLSRMVITGYKKEESGQQL